MNLSIAPDFALLSSADGALLPDLLSGLRPAAVALLTAASVYRGPVPYDALLSAGQARLDLRTHGLGDLIGECAAAGLMVLDLASQPPTVQVAPEIATWLLGHLAETGHGEAVAGAHRCAANYWQWRITARQQNWQDDMHDLLEARHHLIEAEDLSPAEKITEGICSRLHGLGRFAEEGELITDTLAWLPAGSRAAWTYRLGNVCQLQSDYEAAECWFLQALSGFSGLADSHGMASCYGNLGALAHARGDYAEAERCYLKSLALEQAKPADHDAREAVRTRAGQPGPVSMAAAVKRKHASGRSPAGDFRTRRGLAGRPSADDAGTHHGLASRTATGSRRRRALMVLPVIAAAIAAGVALATVRGPDRGAARPFGALSLAATTRDQAAAWIVRWVADDAIVACDPLMCSALQADGVPAARILEITSSATDPLGSDVVVATTAIRSRFGSELSAVFAPAVIASFGSGSTGIEVRVVAADGAAAYRSALRADLTARRLAGAALLGSPRISTSALAARQLAAGQVDSRLLITLAAVAASGPVTVVAFGGAGPGASSGMPLISADIAAGTVRAGRSPTSAQARAAAARSLAGLVAFLRAQRTPLLAASVSELTLPTGLMIVRIDFAAPSPLGLLNSVPASAKPAGPGGPGS